MLILAELSWTQWFLASLIIMACLLLMIVILLQKGRGEGLAGALGGGGGGAFGSKTGDMFTWVTVVLASFVLLLSVVSNFAFDPTGGRPTSPDAALIDETQPAPGSTPDSMMVPISIGEDGKAVIPPGMEGLINVTTDAGTPPSDGAASTGAAPTQTAPESAAPTEGNPPAEGAAPPTEGQAPAPAPPAEEPPKSGDGTGP